MSQTYILLPHGVRTGGPEALLQLSDALLGSGDSETFVVFFDKGQVALLRETPDAEIGASTAISFGTRKMEIKEYAHYRLRVAGEIPNTPDSIVVLPEVLADLTAHFSRTRVILWWLSVDNAFASLARINLNHLRRENVFHATQSAYALRMLEALGMKHAGHLSDYTPERFAGGTPQESRPPCVALNAGIKVVVDLDALEARLTAARPDVQVKRIVKLSRDEVLDTLRRARVFVDLGNFPGKDRLAREAALLGCAVVVADAGAGSTPEDYTLAPEDRVFPWHLDSVAERILQLLADADAASANNARLLPAIHTEKTRFIDEARAVLALVRQAPAPAEASPDTPDRRQITSLPQSGGKVDATPDEALYELWRSRQTPQEIDAELLAERMVLKWDHRPGIHLLLALQPGEESLLADTLDSLAAQLYTEWLLTVVTALPPPEGIADTPQLQWLALRDAAHIDYVIDEMAASSPGSWLARIEPGLTLEPHALQVVADYINFQPGWQLIYTDEDRRDDSGGSEPGYVQPRFKPDFNLDLLRAQDYFGSFTLVAKDSFLSAGRYGVHAGAHNYDLALRIVDQAGDDAIGHISQMLAHRPAGCPRPIAAEAEKSALAAHLARRGLTADILDGPSDGTRRILYRWPNAPLVSIVIQTRDRGEYLRPLLDGIHTRTRYPHYEIIVVDNGSTDPDTLAFLAALETDAPWAGRARVLAQPGEFSWSAGANAGAAVARGDYLLFLDNDTYVAHEEWLDRLMAIAQRSDVGIVAPRLTYPETAKVQHTGWVLGLGGSAGSPWNNTTGITEPCYMDRALCDQEVSAVSGSALLVRRSLFAQLGGMDAARYPLIHGALDLCLRTGEAGSRIVWTPYSTLVHFNGVSMHASQRTPEGMLRFILDSRSANDRLLEQWLPRLAHDPAYNCNLSLVEPYKVEHVAPIDWDPNFHDRPRILGVPLTGGAGEYRLRAPLRAVAKAGLAQTMICEPPVAFSVRILTPVELARAAPDAIILHQPVDDPQTDALESYARFLPHVRRIITMDDLITALPEKNPSFKRRPRDARPRLRRALSLADRLVVSTRPLADLCADMIDDVRIMPNCLEWSLWGDVAPLRLPRKKPRVGWAGAQQHLGDLELIYPVVEALADEVDWIFMGMCPEPLKPFVRESHSFELDFTAYPKALARLDLDLAIAPLEIHAFNEAKSNLRLLEYGAMGWPVICTDIHPYQNAPVTRLPNEPEKWIKAIREQLAEPQALREAGLALQRWVHDGFILENHVASWFAAYGP